MAVDDDWVSAEIGNYKITRLPISMSLRSKSLTSVCKLSTLVKYFSLRYRITSLFKFIALLVPQKAVCSATSARKSYATAEKAAGRVQRPFELAIVNAVA